MADVVLTQNSRLPSLRVVLHDYSGIFDLTNASSVALSMMSSGGANKVSAAACTIESASGGQVRYDWASGDVDTPGIFLAKFLVTISSKTLPFPSDRYLVVDIQETPT